MSSIHFVGGEKGGVGKSVFARVLCQWFIDHSVKLCALDADLSQATLIRSYAQHGYAVDLSVFDSADQIMDRALGAEREVVVDLPSQSLSQLGRWFSAGGVIAAARELNVELVFWHVTDGGFDSSTCLDKTLQLLGTSVPIVVVCNRGRSSEFTHLLASAPLSTAREHGGRLIELPQLDPEIMYKLEGVGASLATALGDGPDSCALTRMQQRRAALWLASAYSEIQPILGATSAEGAGDTTASGEPDDTRAAGESNHGDAANTEASAQSALPSTELHVSDSRTDTPGAGEFTALEAKAETPQDPVTADAIDEQRRPGTVVIDGASTWTEIGEGCQIHHVRYD